MKRLQRRIAQYKQKQLVKKYYPGMTSARLIGSFANNLKRCSKYCCGNPRNHFKVGYKASDERRLLSCANQLSTWNDA